MNELQQRILFEAESWIGTPWREGGSCVKGPGGGVDCSRYVLAVFNACGLCDMYTVPDCSWGLLHEPKKSVVNPRVFMRSPGIMRGSSRR